MQQKEDFSCKLIIFTFFFFIERTLNFFLVFIQHYHHIGEGDVLSFQFPFPFPCCCPCRTNTPLGSENNRKPHRYLCLNWRDRRNYVDRSQNNSFTPSSHTPLLFHSFILERKPSARGLLHISLSSTFFQLPEENNKHATICVKWNILAVAALLRPLSNLATHK